MSQAHDFRRLERELRGGSSFRASALLILVIAFIGTAVIWAHQTEIDDVTRGDGRIVPSSQIQIIQAAESGILKALHVQEGDLVEIDTLLMELDRTMLASQLDQERARTDALRIRIARLKSEIDRTPFNIPENLVILNSSVVLSETALVQARHAEFTAENRVLESQRLQRTREYEEGLVAHTTAGETLALIEEEIAMMAPLVERKLEPETTMLTLRRSRSELEGRETSTAAALKRLDAALVEIDERIAALHTKFVSAALSELSIATAELAELETRLPALEQRVTRSEIRSPVRGIVNRTLLTTIGGVAQAGQELVEIVPTDDTLLVEAYLRPSDIAFLYPDQKVSVKITAYDYSRYGGLDGLITRIGADAIQHPERDEQVFTVHVRTESNILDADGLALEIVPGMVAQIDILSGRKTVLDYLTQPVVRVRDRAFRD
jgi:adhesin transport system membrane fusion protein